MDGKYGKDPDFDLGATIRDIYALTEKLEVQYEGRHFTPDGHMVGSLGEVYAAERYGLSLYVANAPVHDAEAPDGRKVQIKATQGDKVAISEKPDYLIVLHIDKKGSFEEIYNGPGKPVWEKAGKKQKTGQKPISLSKLHKLAAEVSPADRISAVE